MLEIRFTLDATPELISALRDIAGAIHSVAIPVTTLQRAQNDCLVDTCDAADNGQNLANEVSVDPEQAETPPGTEGPKKRKPRAKKARSEGNPPVAPASGDNLSPAGEAEPESKAAIETPAEPEPAPVVADPTPVDGAVSFACASYIGARVSDTTSPEPAHVEEAQAATAEDPLAGKGQTGEILAELTRKAIGDLDALGVDRGDANRRIRAYCDYHEIKFATFPALLHAVGYADAIEICKGNLK